MKVSFELSLTVDDGMKHTSRVSGEAPLEDLDKNFFPRYLEPCFLKAKVNLEEDMCQPISLTEWLQKRFNRG